MWLFSHSLQTWQPWLLKWLRSEQSLFCRPNSQIRHGRAQEVVPEDESSGEAEERPRHHRPEQYQRREGGGRRRHVLFSQTRLHPPSSIHGLTMNGDSYYTGIIYPGKLIQDSSSSSSSSSSPSPSPASSSSSAVGTGVRTFDVVFDPHTSALIPI